MDNTSIRAAFTSFFTSLISCDWGWHEEGFQIGAGASRDRTWVPTSQLYVRLNLQPTRKYHSCIGPTERRAQGILSVEVWGPIVRQVEVEALAGTLETALLAVGSTGGLMIPSATARAGMVIDNLWRQTISCEWVTT